MSQKLLVIQSAQYEADHTQKMKTDLCMFKQERVKFCANTQWELQLVCQGVIKPLPSFYSPAQHWHRPKEQVKVHCNLWRAEEAGTFYLSYDGNTVRRLSLRLNSLLIDMKIRRILKLINCYIKFSTYSNQLKAIVSWWFGKPPNLKLNFLLNFLLHQKIQKSSNLDLSVWIRI